MTLALTCADCGADVQHAMFCSQCGTRVAPAVEEETSSFPFLATEGGGAEVEDQRNGLRWVLVGLALVAAAGLAVGGLGIAQAHQAKAREGALADRVDRLTSQVQQQKTALDTTADTSTITGLRDSLAALQDSVAVLQSGSAKVNGTLASYKNCLPQLQTELDGLSIDYNIDWNNVSNDYFWIQNENQVSTDCSKVLYGTARGD